MMLDEELRPVRAAEVMSRDVIALPVTATLREVATAIRRSSVGAAVVIDDSGNVVGIVSEAVLAHFLDGLDEPATPRRTRSSRSDGGRTSLIRNASDADPSASVG